LHVTCRGHLILPFSGAEWTREASKVPRLGRTPGSEQRQPLLVMERGEQKVHTRRLHQRNIYLAMKTVRNDWKTPQLFFIFIFKYENESENGKAGHENERELT
jgi:hypothetical protein